MRRFPQLLLIPLLAIFGGCATLPDFRSEPDSPPPSDNSAVVALLDTAHRDAASGRLDSAAASLERALRIEPRNAALWHELARLRLEQNQGTQAIQLATKSNTLAGADQRLRAENWRVIGQARAQSGDHRGAEAAFEKAEELAGNR
jgi:cytochrome c-type biogenesis protein CcmH/NrfG